MSELTVRLQALDGFWELVGADRGRGIVPESLSLTWSKWGPDTCRFTIRRDPGGIFPDLREYTPCEIEIAGVVVWGGRVWETPTQEGGDAQISVQGQGWHFHLDDDVYERIYVHTNLSDWKDIRNSLTVDLAMSGWFAGGRVDSGDGAINLTFPDGVRTVTGARCGVVLDLGPDSRAARILVVWKTHGPSSALSEFKVRGHDSDNPNWDPEEIDSDTFSAGLTTTSGGTFSTPRRFLSIYMQRMGSETTWTQDLTAQILSIRVFREAAYESGGQSVLRAHHVIHDALPFAPLLVQDTSLIETTSLDIDSLAPTEDRTPREMWNAVDMYHNWVKMVRADGRPVYKPHPTIPLLRVGSWAGIEFKDASRGSGEDVHNRTVVRGTGPDGQQVKVSRSSAKERSPSEPANTSFTTNTNGWTSPGSSFTRDTSVFASAPASLRVNDATWARAETILTGLTVGIQYTIRVNMRRGLINLPGSFAEIRLGQQLQTVPGEAVSDSSFTPLEATFIAQATTETLRISGQFKNNSGSTLMYIDDVQVLQGITIIDRRGFTRTHVLSMSAPLVEATGAVFGDTYLDTHQGAKLKGDFDAVGSAVRHYLNDAPVHPGHLGLYVNELVNLSHHIDPDTGTIGRDAPIVQVGYTHAERRASVALDAERDNFAALVHRYSMAAGG